MTTHLERLAGFVAELRWNDLPNDTRRAARYQVLNMVAAVHAARSAPEPAAVLRGARAASSEPGPCTIVATGEKAQPLTAAAVNAAYAMAHDFDDIIWMGHTCHSAVFASLAVAEQRGATSEQMLTAVVAANEVSGRLAASCFLGPLNGQMTTYLHAMGAAAATSHLLGLNAAQTTHALALSLSQPNFALQPAFLRPTGKLLSASTPIQTGIQAAFFALEGVTGDPGLLEDQRGFWRQFSFVPLPRMLGDLGTFWAIQTLTIKDYPGCHFFQTACEALAEISAKRALTPQTVARVEVATNKLTVEVNRFGAEYASTVIEPVNVNFDLATTLAVQLHAGRLTPAELDASWLVEHTPQLRAWRNRITVSHAPELTIRVIDAARALPAGRQSLRSLSLQDVVSLRRRYKEAYASDLVTLREAMDWVKAAMQWARNATPATATHSTVPLHFPSSVTVHFTDGTKMTLRRDTPLGSFALPSAEGVLRTKFLAAATALEDAAGVFDAGLSLEKHALEDWVGSAVPTGKGQGKQEARLEGYAALA